MHTDGRGEVERSQPSRGDTYERQILDSVGDGIVVVDADGAISDLNGAAEHLLGLEREQALGRKVDALLPDLGGSLPLKRLLDRSRERGGLDAKVKPNGRTIPVHILVSEAGTDGRRGYVFAIRDFRAVRSEQKRVVEAERLAAVDETMHALAHESRNALQRMQSCLTLIQLRGGTEVEGLVEDMQEAQDQLQRLYDAVGDFAAPLQLQLRKTDVRRLLDKSWDRLRRLWAPKRLVWSTSHGEDVDAKLAVDAMRLTEAFEHVLVNAIEASPERGCIIAVFEADGDGDDARLRITIEDEGRGIELSERERVFDLLYSTKTHGAGMGLAIARRMLREHGGEIAIEPSENGGARVAMTLPRSRVDGDARS